MGVRGGIVHFLEAVASTIDLPEPIVEIGPSSLSSDRFEAFLDGQAVLTADIALEARPTVLADTIRLPFQNETTGTVAMLDTIEHVRNPFLAIGEISRVLRQDGVCIVSAPYDFPIHLCPGDYFRPSPMGLEVLFESFPSLIIASQGRPEFPRAVFVLAFRSSDVNAESISYHIAQTVLTKKAKNPFRWMRFLPHFRKNPYVRCLTLGDHIEFWARGKNGSDEMYSRSPRVKREWYSEK